MSADYGTLRFSDVEFVTLEQGVSPHFQCPICTYQWQPTVHLGDSFPDVFDFNEKVRFVIPAHDDVNSGGQCLASGKTIDLFVAVHKDADLANVLIQRSDAEGSSGIPADWWSRT